jgi:hypothetical protein
MIAPIAPIAAIALCACAAPDVQDAVRRAARWLWSQQAPDGGWHSATYGLLRSGQSLTPFVLDALLDVPEELAAAESQALDRALAFLRAHTADDGWVGMSGEGVMDYPTYATALAVCVWVRLGRPGEALRSVEALRAAQFDEEEGWTPDDAVYGAWGFARPPRPPEPGRVDLSMTRHVLQALRAAGVPHGDPVWRRARLHLERLRTPDSGFVLSRHDPAISKAGDGVSYGSATADGILSLLACGADEQDEMLRGAWEWLRARHRPGTVPGLADESGWGGAMRYYYAAAAAQVWASLAPEDDARAALRRHLIGLQREDGSWRNGNALMKEDDPLIATAFALRALLR